MNSTWMRPLVFGIIVVFSTMEAHAQQNQVNSYRSVSESNSETAPRQSTDPLDRQIDEAIEISSRRMLTAGVHTPWQILHGILAFRQDFKLKQNGQLISALDWLGSGTTWKRMPMFEVTRYGGRAHTFTKPYDFEGHPNQFLAILTMSDLPLNHQFRANGGRATITIAQMVKHAQMTVNREDEITWTLWALNHYLDSDASWKNEKGEYWSIERMVQVQTYDSVFNSSCGGTHGMFALASAYQKYLKTGKPIRGVWFEAKQKIERYITTARSLQNGDGTFSTKHFEGTGFSYDFKERIASSGHMLEWLMRALPDERLKEGWVRNAVAVISSDLVQNRRKTIECGPLYHAVDALVIYRERTRPEFKRTKPEAEIVKKPAAAETKTAQKEQETTKAEPKKIASKPETPESPSKTADVKRESKKSEAEPKKIASERTTPQSLSETREKDSTSPEKEEKKIASQEKTTDPAEKPVEVESNEKKVETKTVKKESVKTDEVSKTVKAEKESPKLEIISKSAEATTIVISPDSLLEESKTAGKNAEKVAPKSPAPPRKVERVADKPE